MVSTFYIWFFCKSISCWAFGMGPWRTLNTQCKSTHAVEKPKIWEHRTILTCNVNVESFTPDFCFQISGMAVENWKEKWNIFGKLYLKPSAIIAAVVWVCRTAWTCQVQTLYYLLNIRKPLAQWRSLTTLSVHFITGQFTLQWTQRSLQCNSDSLLRQNNLGEQKIGDGFNTLSIFLLGTKYPHLNLILTSAE